MASSGLKQPHGSDLRACFRELQKKPYGQRKDTDRGFKGLSSPVPGDLISRSSPVATSGDILGTVIVWKVHAHITLARIRSLETLLLMFYVTWCGVCGWNSANIHQQTSDRERESEKKSIAIGLRTVSPELEISALHTVTHHCTRDI